LVYDYLSVAYTKAGRWQEAASALRRAIDLAPQDGRHYFQLGQLYQRHGLRDVPEPQPLSDGDDGPCRL